MRDDISRSSGAAADPHPPPRDPAEDLRGEALCKAGLLQAMNLPRFDDVPVVGVASVYRRALAG